MEYKIVFQPLGVTAEIRSGETVLHAAQRRGIPIDAYCGAQKVCGKCRVKIIEGIFDEYGIQSSIKNTSSITDIEKKLLTPQELAENYRLACAARVHGELVVETRQITNAAIILEQAQDRTIELKPSVKLYRIALDKATLQENTDDFSRVKAALTSQYPKLRADLDIELAVLRKLPRILRDNDWQINAAVLYDKKIINVTGTDDNDIYGVAFDIGTTTIAAYLCDLKDGGLKQTASMLNPQIPYGEDVLTRVSYCQHNENGTGNLRDMLLTGLNRLLAQLSSAQGIARVQIVESVVVCNTVMQHIALGINPESIGKSPFTLALTDAIDMSAGDFGLDILQSGNVHFLPMEAGFIGSDNVAALIAEEPYLQDGFKLLIDIGTNSEICLGNRDGLFVTSCATGPALEGAQIECGTRAVTGAIEGVKIDAVTLEPSLRIIGGISKPAGICGSGIIDAVAQMAAAGIIEPDGKFSKFAVSGRIRRGKNGKPEYVLYYDENDGNKDIVVTQNDVRAVQLAKAALYAGAKALMDRCGVGKLREIVLTGGFGNYIDKHSALDLGLYPDCHIDNVTAVGNAAGLGARLALLNNDKRREAVRVAGSVKLVETAADPRFQSMFARAMAIPHATDCFTENLPAKWACSGKDDRAVSPLTLALGPKPFADAGTMDQAIIYNRETAKNPYLVYPIIQKIEAAALGASPEIVGNTYAFKIYPYQSIEELEKSISFLEKPVIRDTLQCIKRHSEEKQMLEVCGPFSILSALTDPMQLYAGFKKKRDRLADVLDSIADALAEYTIEAITAGIDIISFADPEGNMELVGEAFYKELSGAAVGAYFRKIRNHLDNTLLHVCGKTSGSLQKAGFAIPKVYRVPEGRDYIELLLEYAGKKDFRFVGFGCVHMKKMTVPIITRLDLVNI